MQSVKYAVQYATLNVSDAEYDLVHSLYNLGEPQKIVAMKFIRNQYRIGLKESKDVSDAIGKCPRPSDVDF